MISRVRTADLSVVVVHRDARHGMDYDRLDSHLVAHGSETLSVIARACSSVRLIEDHGHGSALERKACVNLIGMPDTETTLRTREHCKLTATTSHTVLRKPLLCSDTACSCNSVG